MPSTIPMNDERPGYHIISAFFPLRREDHLLEFDALPLLKYFVISREM
jgi:hypothetical protein